MEKTFLYKDVDDAHRRTRRGSPPPPGPPRFFHVLIFGQAHPIFGQHLFSSSICIAIKIIRGRNSFYRLGEDTIPDSPPPPPPPLSEFWGAEENIRARNISPTHKAPPYSHSTAFPLRRLLSNVNFNHNYHSKNTWVSVTRNRVHWGHILSSGYDQEFGQLSAH